MRERKKAQQTDEHTLAVLRDVHKALLRLHKALLDSERANYEETHGKVTNAQMLNLAMDDDHFNWLRSIAQVIIGIDQMVDGEQPATPADAEGVLKYLRVLLKPAESGDEFGRRYFAAIQRDPNSVLAHREVLRLIGEG